MKKLMINFLLYFLPLIVSVILSLSKDRVLFQENLRRIPSHFDKLSVTSKVIDITNNVSVAGLSQHTPVILSSSKDEVFSQENLRRIPPHFPSSSSG